MGDKVTVELIRRNWDMDYIFDLSNGKGFTITQPSIVQLDKKPVRSLHGTRSPLYGTDFSDDQSFIERYKCECGAIKGAQFEGESCPICHTNVAYKDVDIEMTGWMTLGDKYIVSPYYYQLLSNALGSKVLSEIVITKKKVDRDGHITQATADDCQDKPKSIFSGIGVTEFRDRFEEIMEYFFDNKIKKKNQVKADMITRIIGEKDKVFVSKIPIYSTLLRPQSQTTDSFYFNSIDKEIEPLYNLCEHLKNTSEIDEYYTLSRIQKRVNNLWEKNFNLIKGKNGFIRDQILGGGLNYTARNVIIPNKDLKADELAVSYHTFRILFKDVIIKYLVKMCNITITAAAQKWHEGHIFDSQIYEVMQTILEKEKPKMLINRNPTLNFYSMLLMKIKTISSDPTDYTLGIPFFILPGLNADQPNQGLCIAVMLCSASRERLTSGVSYNIAC